MREGSTLIKCTPPVNLISSFDKSRIPVAVMGEFIVCVAVSRQGLQQFPFPVKFKTLLSIVREYRAIFHRAPQFKISPDKNLWLGRNALPIPQQHKRKNHPPWLFHACKGSSSQSYPEKVLNKKMGGEPRPFYPLKIVKKLFYFFKIHVFNVIAFLRLCTGCFFSIGRGSGLLLRRLGLVHFL